MFFQRMLQDCAIHTKNGYHEFAAEQAERFITDKTKGNSGVDASTLNHNAEVRKNNRIV